MSTFAQKRRLLKTFRLMMAFYKPRVYRPILAFSMLIALVSCTKDDDSGGDNPAAGNNPEVLVETEGVPDPEAGLIDVSFQVDAPDNAVQLIATSDGRRLRLVELARPDGDLIFDSASARDTKYTSAGTFQNSPLTFNYPQLASQAALTAGEYRARYELEPLDFVPTVEGEEPPAELVKLEVLSKSDGDFTRGTVNMNAFLSGSIAGSRAHRTKIEDSLELMREMLGRYEIAVHVEMTEVPALPEVLPDPVTGDVIYEELGAVTEEGINMYFVNEAEGIENENYVSAKAGSSPGAFLPSSRSAIVISVSDAVGGDGVFDSDEEDEGDQLEDSEVRLLAENIAHELLSYMGLRDTVTFSGGEVTDSDGLDSEKCSSFEACEENNGANGNIMFPFPLLDDEADEESYFPRDRLTAQQVELVQRSIALD